jgi:hypothetical protein
MGKRVRIAIGKSASATTPAPATQDRELRLRRACWRKVHGAVSVRLLGFDGDQRADAVDEVARIVSSATTSVFPAAVIPVEIDLHFMPEDARFSLAKRVAGEKTARMP